jgi:hypothetical protein
MEEKKSKVFDIDVGVGIMGMTSYSTSEGENSKITVIERHGSMIGNVIPSVIVICEDNLAKTIINMVADEVRGAYKIITAGAWDNMPTLLYGIYVYREQLKASGDRRFLEVICITDGDIRNEHLNEVLGKVHRGINVPEDMKKALALTKESLYSFSLEHSKSVAGLPEYHHQLWLNEVSQEAVSAYHQEKIKMLESGLEYVDEKHILPIKVQLMLVEKEMAEVNRIANASRGILFYELKDDKDRIDCHKFYGVLKDQLSKGDTLMNYSLYNLEYSVLSIIKKYNANRWQAYIAQVKDAMNKAFDHHLEMFSPDRFNLTELGSKK